MIRSWSNHANHAKHSTAIMTIKWPPIDFRLQVLAVSLPTHAPAGALAHRPATARRKAVWPWAWVAGHSEPVLTDSDRIRLDRAPHPASGVNALCY